MRPSCDDVSARVSLRLGASPSRSQPRGPLRLTLSLYPTVYLCLTLSLYPTVYLCLPPSRSPNTAPAPRWYVRNELTAVIQFKKYRVMRQRYKPFE
jgi:hypothetical protein